MAKKRKVRADRVIILILAAVLFTGLLCFEIITLINTIINHKTDNTHQTIEYTDPTPVDTTQGIKVELMDYANYIDDTDKLGFNFIVATFKFSSESSVSFDLEGRISKGTRFILSTITQINFDFLLWAISEWISSIPMFSGSV